MKKAVVGVMVVCGLALLCASPNIEAYPDGIIIPVIQTALAFAVIMLVDLWWDLRNELNA